jgi:hypothetical protein
MVSCLWKKFRHQAVIGVVMGSKISVCNGLTNSIECLVFFPSRNGRYSTQTECLPPAVARPGENVSGKTYESYIRTIVVP